MTLTIDAQQIQMAIAACAFLVGAIVVARRALGRVPFRSARVDLLLGLVALVSCANYFLLGRDPGQFVKTWDMQHTYFGSKYAAELGYSRLYECLLFFDARADRFYGGVSEVRDLRTQERVPVEEALRGSDCDARFPEERRREFARDLAFFQGLPRQPRSDAWFTDNGYNQTPFFTALTSPLLKRAPLGYGLLLGLSFVDVLLVLAVFPLVYRSFGPRTCFLAAIFFFTSFANQFALMGGSLLRFGYLASLILAACAFETRRHRAAGVAVGLATLLQVFPAVYALGLALWAGLRALRAGRLPDWFVPFTVAFLGTLAVGTAVGVLVAGPDASREFAHRMALHSGMLSVYRVGLKWVLVAEWPIPPGGQLAYDLAMQHLRDVFPLYLAIGGALTLAPLALRARLSALEFGFLFGSVALYVLTPVHYYYAALVLLFFRERGEGGEPPHDLTRTLLFLLSAGAFAVFRRGESLALVNHYWLSFGLLAFFCIQIAAFYAAGGGRRRIGSSTP